MRMKKMILLGNLFIWMALVSLAVAQPRPAPAPAVPATTSAPGAEKPKIEKVEKIAGPIGSIDETARTIVVRGKALGVDDKTKITRGGKALPFGDLKKDMEVAAEYRKDGEKMIAVTIRVQAPKPVPKSTPKEAPKK